MRATQIVLAARPSGQPTTEDFRLREAELPELREDVVLVRNTAMQLTGVMADLMRGEELPMPPYLVGEPLWSAAVGVVVSSRNERFKPGDVVQSMNGWRSHFVAAEHEIYPVDSASFPNPEVALCQGPTAYHGMVDIAQVGPGDTVFVTGAAGGVGSLAGQIARKRGAQRVVGTAGSEEKVRWLVDELGFDAAFNYKQPGLEEWVTEQFPAGFSVLFDTVGGAQFELAVRTAGQDARFALCGTLAQQFHGADHPDHPRFDILTAIRKQLRVLPFSTYHTSEQLQAWATHYAAWLHEGDFAFPHTSVPGGLAAAPEALLSLTRSAYRGNVIVPMPETGAV